MNRITITYEKDLTDEEKRIFNAGRRSLADELSAWGKARLADLDEAWVLDKANREGIRGHTVGIDETIAKARRLA